MHRIPAAGAPSHSGDLAECLQPQNQTLPSASAVYLTGTKSVPRWLPSQNGCFALRPQAHHQ